MKCNASRGLTGFQAAAIPSAPTTIPYTEDTHHVIIALMCTTGHWPLQVLYESFWFTKLGLICSPGLAVSKIFNNFLSLLIPLIDTEQTHCCRCYVT